MKLARYRPRSRGAHLERERIVRCSRRSAPSQTNRARAFPASHGPRRGLTIGSPRPQDAGARALGPHGGRRDARVFHPRNAVPPRPEVQAQRTIAGGRVRGPGSCSPEKPRSSLPRPSAAPRKIPKRGSALGCYGPFTTKATGVAACRSRWRRPGSTRQTVGVVSSSRAGSPSKRAPRSRRPRQRRRRRPSVSSRRPRKKRRRRS